ncbi:MAG: GntR family transcriptional regulator [Sphingobium sp.]
MVRNAASPIGRRDRLIGTLRSMIVLGDLAPGEILRDAELAERFGVSNSPVREALMTLANEGLVEMPAYRTKRVAPLDRRASLDDLAVLRLLAADGYRTGIARMRERDLGRMQAALAGHHDAIECADRQREWSCSIDFHDAIIRAGGNARLADLAISLQGSLERVALAMALYKTQDGRASMRRIAAAAIACDTEAAIAALMDGHDVAAEAIKRLLPNASAGDDRSARWRVPIR